MKKYKVKMGQIDFVLFATIMLLVAIGVVMVYSSSSYYAAFKSNDPELFFKKQFMWACIGCVFMVTAIKTDYHIIKKYTGIIMIFTAISLLAVFAFSPINFSRRWIPLGFAKFQPSEVAKYAIVLYMAKSLDLKGEKVKEFVKGVLPYLLVSGFYAGLILLEPNLSIAAIIMIVTVIILFAVGARFQHLFAIGSSLVAAVVALAIFEPYRLARVMNFRNPFDDSQGKGYQLVQSLLALGSGGFTGSGIGQSRQKCLYIPEPHTDFIFAIIGEELGLIGCGFIILLFIIFVWRGIKIAVTAKDMYGTILAIGITSVIAVQAIINIAVVTGSMPVTGVPLPFISYGGSALLFNMFAMGILLNVSRQTVNKN
ncbi:stage V sporulation protein E [Clostridium sp. CM028]|uniref:stage V sporulation protein E n=1 Tax=Clostridium TaxID=1485 RepID=UPI0013EEB6E2|nr:MULTISPECIES: stage V sporulation protein E [Clostridium]MBU3091515.1 stage V sporulation protein E [Clostridium sp. CF011]MBW9147469.1 stage V sporulation protein E [Clostridium sp. CM028]MBZ9608427.1 stage V sporulation protein E [Clostridium estertheticum]WAG70136.1 stage V sporulation protein E [Clostridium sp. CF011]WLC61808.1 stage V sporulation protein E [Clostridium sp. CM028]